MSFAALPTELKLTVLSQTHPTGHISTEIDALNRYINTKKVEHYLRSTPLLVSIYSSHGKDSHKKCFYEAVVASTSRDECVITLGALHHKESLIKVTHQKDTYVNRSHLDVIMNQEQVSSKIFVSLVEQESMNVVWEKSGYVQEGQNVWRTEVGDLEICMKKGEMEPPKEGLYDWDDCYNFGVTFEGFGMKNEDIVRMFEKEKCLIVRY